MNEKQRDILFDIYIDTVSELQKYLWIEHFQIDLQGVREHSASASIDITYKYFSASITFKNDIIYDIEHILDTPFKVISDLFMHECFHIFCSVGTSYLKSQEDNLRICLSQKEYAMHNNAMITLEEQMVVTLEKTFSKEFIKTHWYKKLEKRYNAIVKELES